MSVTEVPKRLEWRQCFVQSFSPGQTHSPRFPWVMLVTWLNRVKVTFAFLMLSHGVGLRGCWPHPSDEELKVQRWEPMVVTWLGNVGVGSAVGSVDHISWFLRWLYHIGILYGGVLQLSNLSFSLPGEVKLFNPGSIPDSPVKVSFLHWPNHLRGGGAACYRYRTGIWTRATGESEYRSVMDIHGHDGVVDFILMLLLNDSEMFLPRCMDFCLDV